MNEKAQSFFFTNFLDLWDSGALWKMFSHYGRVVDVYIAFKRTKKGIRFSFVRFKNIDDIMAFKRRLKGILIGDSRREKNRFIHSFKDTVVGTSLRPQPSTLNVRVEEDGYLRRRLEKCWVGKAKKFQVLQNVWDIMKNNGLVDCNVTYIGGLSLLFEWKYKDLARGSLESNKIWLMQWFDDLQPWDEKCDPYGRLIWLNLEGLPILARNNGVVKSVAGDRTVTDEVNFKNDYNNDKSGFSSRHEKNINSLIKPSPLSSNGLPPPPPYELYLADSSPIVYLVKPTSKDVYHNPNSFDIHDLNIPHMASGESNQDELELDELLCSFQRISNSAHQYLGGKKKKQKYKKKKLAVDGISLNCNGLGADNKKSWIRSLAECENLLFYGIHETKDANSFNEFVARVGLFDFLPKGRRFTRFEKYGKKASKLDRVLVFHNLFDFWKDAAITVLCRSWSDHCPISLKVGLLNSGSKPYRIFEKWIGEWDVKAKNVLINEMDVVKCEEWIMDLNQLDQIHHDDLKQKCHLRWATEGDENTWFFHSLLKYNYFKSNINEIPINGVWCESPESIKHAALDHFSSRFKENVISRPCFYSPLFHKLSSLDASYLESSISVKEIKEAVWSCATSKAPSSDGFNFNFIKTYWEIVKQDFGIILNILKLQIISKILASRTALIENFKLLVFKVDFEKAFDSVNWDFLLDV
ncbi:nucleotide-binding alpha-beta plait domain-containing protein [Tanacetum coccineum]